MAINFAARHESRAERGRASELESRLLRVYRASSLLLTSLQRASGDAYRINPGDVLMLRHAVEAAAETVAKEAGR